MLVGQAWGRGGAWGWEGWGTQSAVGMLHRKVLYIPSDIAAFRVILRYAYTLRLRSLWASSQCKQKCDCMVDNLIPYRG